MKLAIAACLLMLTLTVEARKPAVEDFVGIESTTPDIIPSGTEAMFNFNKEVTAYAKDGPSQPVVRYMKEQPKMESPTASTGSFSLWFGIGFVLALPMITWAVMSQHLKARDAVRPAATATVTDLASRRAEKQAQTSSKPDDIKKAS